MLVCNWNEYNKHLKKRAKIFSFLKDVIPIWYEDNNTRRNRGRPFKYSNEAIMFTVAISYLCRLSLRGSTSLISDAIETMNINLDTPDFSIISRRIRKMDIKIKDHRSSLGRKRASDGLVILIDSTSVNIYNASHMKENSKTHLYKHYDQVRKMHIALDLDSKQVMNFEYSEGSERDHRILPPLINNVDYNIKEVIADRAYDTLENHKVCVNRNILPTIPPNPNSVSHKDISDLYYRNCYVEEINNHANYPDGFKEWKIKHGYGRRAIAEAYFSRFKRIFGFNLRCKTERNRQQELLIKCNLLNKFISFDGYPVFKMADS